MKLLVGLFAFNIHIYVSIWEREKPERKNERENVCIMYLSRCQYQLHTLNYYNTSYIFISDKRNKLGYFWSIQKKSVLIRKKCWVCVSATARAFAMIQRTLTIIDNRWIGFSSTVSTFFFFFFCIYHHFFLYPIQKFWWLVLIVKFIHQQLFLFSFSLYKIEKAPLSNAILKLFCKQVFWIRTLNSD